jgi:hypothetical protein
MKDVTGLLSIRRTFMMISLISVPELRGILQKFSNYRVRLAIIGDFSGFKSKNLNDFFRESNRMGCILFLNDIEEALARLGK